MTGFQDWFDRSSGYAPHYPRPVRRVGCCASLKPEGRAVWLPLPGAPEPVPCPLYNCPACGKRYALCQGASFLVESLLRYRVTNWPEKN